MSLQTCKEFVRHNKSNNLLNVVLIHASGSTLDFDNAVKEVKSIVDSDVEVVMAKPGIEIEIQKEAF